MNTFGGASQGQPSAATGSDRKQERETASIERRRCRNVDFSVVDARVGEHERDHDDHGEDAHRLCNCDAIDPCTEPFHQCCHLRDTTKDAGEKCRRAIRVGNATHEPSAKACDCVCRNRSQLKEPPIEHHLQRHHQREIQPVRCRQCLALFAVRTGEPPSGRRRNCQPP